MHFSTSAYLAALSSALVSALPAELEIRVAVAPQCAADNCYRYFKSVAVASASSFCLSYLSTTQGTITITGTTTAITTPTITSTYDAIYTTTPGVTSTTTLSPSLVNKRQVSTNPFAVKASAACTSANGIAQASRLSSACSCVITSATTSIAYTAATNTAPAVSITQTTTVSTSTASTTYATVTLAPFCQNAADVMQACDPAIGCYRNDYPPDSPDSDNNAGCQGCLKRGAGCDDGNTYCIVGYRDQGPTCTYDSDCSSGQYGYYSPYCMLWPGGLSFCGANKNYADGTYGGDLYCMQRPAAVRRDEEWAAAVGSRVEGVVYADTE